MSTRDFRLAYGMQAVRQALRRGQATEIYIQEDVGSKRLGRLAGEIERSSAKVVSYSAADMRQLTGTDKHQGVAAIVSGARSLTEREAQELVRRLTEPLLLVLDGVQDPRNFGSILRTADAAGVDLVVTARSRNVGMTPVVSKVACGAAEVQPVAEVGNLARFLQFLAEAGVTVVGADDGAEASIYATDLSAGVALVLGGEGQGLRRLTRENCHRLVQIPMQGVVESLNVGVAAGVCLYEALRQRLARPGTLG